MSQNLPNFLIVGMAKCGTSSLSQYLQQHPDIFISSKKEPRFITSQVMKAPLGGPKDHEVENWYVKDFEEYKALFNSASEMAVGEASADTLFFYKDTIPVIKRIFGDPKIIIILRNPVKRAFSAYQHLIRDDRENLSFEKALDEEENRISENYELIYFYKKAGLYYEAVKAFRENFSKVKIILSDELRTDQEGTVQAVYAFLGVDKGFKPDFTMKLNISGKPKSKLLLQSLKQETLLRKMFRPIIRTIMPAREDRMRFFNWLWGKNMKSLTLNKDTETQLKEFFKKDILRTEELIQKDLKHWL